MIRILVDSLADAALTNAQMVNAREIVSRLDPARFHVSMFHVADPDPRISRRPATRLLKLPTRRQTPVILAEFLRGHHDIIFYLKSSPAAKWFLRSSVLGRKRGRTIGTIESQCDLHNESTVTAEAVRLWEQTVLRCDFLFANSRSVQRSLMAEYRLGSEIIPTGVDTKFFSPIPRASANARPRVLFVGSLRPFKGPQLALDAAAHFPGVDFVIVGDGISGPELCARANREHLTNVKFTGLLSPEGVRQEYHAADLLFFPSIWEGSPKVILEAAACGLPVLASSKYEPETVIHGQTGLLVSQPAEFFQHLKVLLGNPELRHTMGRAGRLHAERFDWDLMTRQWENAFERIAALAPAHLSRARVAASL